MKFIRHIIPHLSNHPRCSGTAFSIHLSFHQPSVCVRCGCRACTTGGLIGEIIDVVRPESDSSSSDEIIHHCEEFRKQPLCFKRSSPLRSKRLASPSVHRFACVPFLFPIPSLSPHSLVVSRRHRCVRVVSCRLLHSFCAEKRPRSLLCLSVSLFLAFRQVVVYLPLFWPSILLFCVRTRGLFRGLASFVWLSICGVHACIGALVSRPLAAACPFSSVRWWGRWKEC